MPEIDLGLFAGLTASIDGMTAALKREAGWRQRKAQVIRQVPLAPPQANAAGVIDSPQSLRAPDGYYWSVRRLTLSGFTAGTAVVYLNGLGGEPVAPFAEAATFTFGRGELLLHPGDRLVVQASGITGYVQLNGAADAFESWYLPWYIG